MPTGQPNSPAELSHDTIVASAGGSGRSARALLRVSGPGVQHVAALLLAEVRPGSFRSSIRMGEGRSLPVLAMLSRAPRSYTGEDTLEILLPGNLALVDRLTRLLTTIPGVREAEPGEFSARAYLAGKLSLAEAEGVAGVIAAGTQEELDAARRALRGESGREWSAWIDELATLLALVEAGIDFSDQEEVVAIEPQALAARLDSLAAQMTAALGSARGSESASWLPRVVLAGPPSAGKSTLFNALLGRERAVTSPLPGTTRDVLREPLRLTPGSRTPVESGSAGGLEVELIDLAGIDPRPGSHEIDREAQQRAREEIAAAEVVIWCDPTGRFESGAAPIISPDSVLLRVALKADLLPSPVAGRGVIGVCALDRRGLDELRQAILHASWGRGGAGGESGAVGRQLLLPRHRRSLLRCLHEIRRAREELGPASGLASPPTRPSSPAELIAGILREALDHAGDLVGRIDPDEILGRVFATFCIGK